MLRGPLEDHDYYEFEHKTRGVDGSIGLADIRIRAITSPANPGWIVTINEHTVLKDDDTDETAVFPTIAEAKAQAAWFVLHNALITAQGAQRLLDDIAKQRIDPRDFEFFEV